MPNKQAAIKYIRKTKRRTARNLVIKNRLKKLLKQTRFLIAEGNKKKAEEYLKRTIKALDKATEHDYIKKNTANRKKSRLTLAFNKMPKTKAKSAKKTSKTKKSRRF